MKRYIMKRQLLCREARAKTAKISACWFWKQSKKKDTLEDSGAVSNSTCPLQGPAERLRTSQIKLYIIRGGVNSPASEVLTVFALFLSSSSKSRVCSNGISLKRTIQHNIRFGNNLWCYFSPLSENWWNKRFIKGFYLASHFMTICTHYQPLQNLNLNWQFKNINLAKLKSKMFCKQLSDKIKQIKVIWYLYSHYYIV